MMNARDFKQASGHLVPQLAQPPSLSLIPAGVTAVQSG
jgi:hypothetical protein